MIKKLTLLICFLSSFVQAQHTIKGYMSPNIESDWVILYKIEGTKQVFVNNTTIKKDSIEIGGVKQAVGKFEITLPNYAKPGAYRATYRLEGSGFVDFYYNKEDISFIYNPEYPNQSIAFSKSIENKLYKDYIASITKVQQKLDSIQVAVLQQPNIDLKEDYKKAIIAINKTQVEYEEKAKDLYVLPIIRASLRTNSPTILTSVNDYINNIKNTFFNKVDFSNQILVNSSFITNRILDYIFYINFAEDKNEQQILYKESIETILAKVNNNNYKRDIIQFLIEQFESSKNLEIIDFLFEKHYNKLPISLQDSTFKKEKQALFKTEIGRIAPDFSWTENGRFYKLSTLNDAEKYVLVFWSTGCSHCLREIPELYTYMKGKNNTKVIAFALEDDEFVWKQYSNANLKGWHNVLGLNKWQNKTSRTYQVNSTPTYFILDKNKKIIAKPNEISDVRTFLNKN